MAGDRARVSYDASRKWRGLVAQQGRVTIEADWNEAATIDHEHDRRVALDLVGGAGTPDGGYTVTPVQATDSPASGILGDFTIGQGTVYVGGQRLDLEEPVTYSAQPDWLDYSTDPLWIDPVAAVPLPVSPPATSYELVYLLAFEQEVCAVEDPALADVALGGPDTMQRQRILQHFVRQPSPSGSSDDSWDAFKSSLAGSGLRFDAASMMVESNTKLLVSFPEIVTQPSLCQPVATGGYLGAENQMIRVMVLGVDDSGEPVIIWGFDDASFLYRVTSTVYDSNAGTTTLTLASSPPDSFHFPVQGQAVEVLRDAVRLTGSDYIASPGGFVSTLVTGYDNTTKRLTITGQLPADYLSTTATPQLYLRVWRAVTPVPTLPATPSSRTEYGVQLDGIGVEVTLSSSSGVFHAGDFWRFALRPLQPAVVYPARIYDAPQPPDGPRTWACPLAVLTWEAGNPSSVDCLRQFQSLIELTESGGGCCTINVGPSDVSNGATLPLLLESCADMGPVTICLEPGDYTLSRPLVFGPELDGVTLQGCREGVVLQAPAQPGNEFGLGLIVLEAVNGVTIRGIELAAPLVAFQPPAGSFSSLSGANLVLMQAVSSGLQVAIGIFAQDCTGVTVEDCTLSLPDPGEANIFGAGIVATGAMQGIDVTGCTFRSANPPARIPFNQLAVTQIANNNQVGAPPPYQLTFGYVQLPSAIAATQQTVPQIFHDATIKRALFEGLTIPALVMAQLGTLRIDANTVRNSYGGFWLVSIADAVPLSIFGQLTVGDPALYQDYAKRGIAALRDSIFLIASQIGHLLLTTAPGGAPAAPSAVAGPTGAHLALPRETLRSLRARVQRTASAATGQPPAGGASVLPAPATLPPGIVAKPPSPVPVADTGASVSLRLDICDCQIDAIVAASYSGAGLLVVDLNTDWGSAVVHGNRIRSRFPKGETALISGLGEATVTGNIVANESATSNSLALNPAVAGTQFGPILDPSTAPLAAAAVVITGNVFINPASLPARTATASQAPPFNDWMFLNTEADYGVLPPPAVLSISPSGGPSGTSVKVAGSGFTGATAVTFGATPAASFTVVSDTQLTAVSPAGSGTVDVTVTAPSGTSGANPGDQFTYLAVTGLNPTTGAAAGGYTIQVIGSGFTGATTVRFGANAGTDLLVAPDGNSLTVKVPPGSGTVDVTVTTPLGTSPTVPADQFTYKTGKESKEHKDGKEHKDFKEKEKEFKEKEAGREAKIRELIDQPLRFEPIAKAVDAGSPIIGRAFIAPQERPEVGIGALRDPQENP